MKKLDKVCLVFLLVFSLCACSKGEVKETKTVKQTKTTEKKEEKIYSTGESVTYTKNNEDLFSFTVDSVTSTDERNEFSDQTPEQVIIIHYSY